MAHSTSASTVWTLGSLTILSALLVALRLALKRQRAKPFRWDDFFLVGAWVFLLCSFALVAAAAGEGYGQHPPNPEPELEPKMMRLLSAAEFCAVFAAAAAKTSIGCTLLYARPERRLREVIFGFLALTDVITVGMAGFLAFWRKSLDRFCMAKGVAWRAAVVGAGTSAVADFIFVLVPWLFFPRNMRIRERLGLGMMVCLGMFAGTAAIIKITTLACDDFGQSIAATSTNPTIWTFLEPASMVLAASIPVLHLMIIPRDDDSQLEPLDPNEPPFPTLGRSVSTDSRRATWTVTGGPFDPFDPENAGIPLQPLGPAAHRTIVRTEAVVVEVEDVEEVRRAARGRARARQSFPL